MKPIEVDYDKPLDPRAVKELEDILDKIEIGEYAHDQTVLRNDCGTAFCVAGWWAMRYIARKLHKPVRQVIQSATSEKFWLGHSPSPENTIHEFQVSLGLSHIEMIEIVDANATLENLQYIVSKLKAGFRLISLGSHESKWVYKGGPDATRV